MTRQTAKIVQVSDRYQIKPVGRGVGVWDRKGGYYLSNRHGRIAKFRSVPKAAAYIREITT